MKNTKKKIGMALALVGLLLVVFILLPAAVLYSVWRTERLQCFCIQCGDMVVAEGSFLDTRFTNLSETVEYVIDYTRPTIFSKVFDSEQACASGVTFIRDMTNPGVGVIGGRFLMIEGYQYNILGRWTLHFSAFGIDYYFDCSEVGSPLSKATAKGLAFQKFLLGKKEEDPEIISALQESFLMSRNEDNELWHGLLEQFKREYKE